MRKGVGNLGDMADFYWLEGKEVKIVKDFG